MEIYSSEPLQLKTGKGSGSKEYISMHDCDGRSSSGPAKYKITFFFILKIKLGLFIGKIKLKMTDTEHEKFLQ